MKLRQKKRIALTWWIWLKMDEPVSEPNEVKAWLDEFYRTPLDEIIATLTKEFKEFPPEGLTSAD
jgi:hypothetical protein